MVQTEHSIKVANEIYKAIANKNITDIQVLQVGNLTTLADVFIIATAPNTRMVAALCDEVEELILAGKDYVEKDIEYHTKIASCSKNIVMPTLIPIITTSIALFIDITKKVLKKETIETHREILHAIEQGRGADAHDAMLLHLVYNRRNISQLNQSKK